MRKQVKPFLKWAGGKTQLLNDIEKQFPFAREESFTFIEPFVGSGAVLFWVLNNFPNVKRCVINDINGELINTYEVIRDHVSELVEQLSVWEQEYHAIVDSPEEKKAYYYGKRASFNSKEEPNVRQAALFIFLNRTCFNGLYRVNKKGGFNVPIGSYKAPKICDAENLSNVSSALQRVTILNGDFEETLAYADEQTCFYLDPPYKPLSASSSFNSYAKDEFDDAEQIRLKEFCETLNVENHQWILSNSDVNQEEHAQKNFFDELYSEFQINRVQASRAINSNSSKRGQISELLITNNGRFA